MLAPRFAAAILAAAFTVPCASAAFAAGPAEGGLSASYVGPGSGMNSVVSNAAGVMLPAAQYKLDAGGSKVTAYALGFDEKVTAGSVYTSVGWAPSGVPGLDRVAGIVAHHDTLGTPLEDPRKEAAAVQLAVWAADGEIALDASTVPFDDYRARAQQLVTAAVPAAEPSAEVAVAATSTPAAGGATVAVNVAGSTGVQAGAPVKVTSASGSADAVTAADGKASVTIPGAGSVPADVSAQVTFAPGVVLAAPDGTAMVLAEPVTTSRDATVTLAAAAAVTPSEQAGQPAGAPAAVETDAQTPAPSGVPDVAAGAAAAAPSSAPAPTASPAATAAAAGPTSLPDTGSDAAPWMVGACLAAAAAGGGLLLWSRRQPTSKV